MYFHKIYSKGNGAEVKICMFLSINDFEYFRLLLMRCWGSITKKIKWENDSGISLHLNSNILLRECMHIFSNIALKSFHPEQPVCGHD